MAKRLYGPPAHSEDPYAGPMSPRGIPVDQLVSVLQKEIRRGNVDNVVLAAYEMLSTSADVAEHLWRRLKIIAVEDAASQLGKTSEEVGECGRRNASFMGFAGGSKRVLFRTGGAVFHSLRCYACQGCKSQRH